MRLNESEIGGIKESVAEVFGPSATVRLFGSRVDDHKRGGDIDLLIEVPEGRDGWDDEMAIARAMLDRLGERKIDMLLHVPGTPMPPIVEIAYRDGVLM